MTRTWKENVVFRRFSLLLLLLLVLTGSLTVRSETFAADSKQRVFDEAGLFAAAEIRQMEQRIQTLENSMNMELVIVTTEDAQGKSAEAYADDYYDTGGFGQGKDKNGALFLIDMDNREIYISTSGAMIRYLTDSRLDQILDDGYQRVRIGDYAGAAEIFLADTEVFYRKGIPGGQYSYDPATGEISRYRSIRWYEFLGAFGVAAFCAAGACASVKQEYAMKQQRRQASGYNMAYRADAQFAIRSQNDVLADRFVTHRLIPRPSGGGRGPGSGSGGGSVSTTHRSSGGENHGGRGRSF